MRIDARSILKCRALCGSARNIYTWEEVDYHIYNGTYRDVYSIGDSVPLDLGSEGLINMQIAAFDTDTLADGSGTAAISWVGKELLITRVQQYSNNFPDANIAWESCGVRTHLQNTVSGIVPPEAKKIIVPVNKTSILTTAEVSGEVRTTVDELWIPSVGEVINGVYSELFPDDNSRKKWWAGHPANNEYACGWWLRDRQHPWVNMDKYSFAGISVRGSRWHFNVNYSDGYICLGFCTGKSK